MYSTRLRPRRIMSGVNISKNHPDVRKLFFVAISYGSASPGAIPPCNSFTRKLVRDPTHQIRIGLEKRGQSSFPAPRFYGGLDGTTRHGSPPFLDTQMRGALDSPITFACRKVGNMLAKLRRWLLASLLRLLKLSDRWW